MSRIHTLYRGSAALAGVLLSGTLACSIVSPPPITPIHRVPKPMDVERVTISLIGGFAGGAFADGSYGGLLRIGYQRDSSTELGLDLLAGHSPAPKEECESGPFSQCSDITNRPSWLLGTRLWGSHVPHEDASYFATRAGVGYQVTDTGIHMITGDIALHVGGSVTTNVGGYLAPTFAISIPIRPGPVIVRKTSKGGPWNPSRKEEEVRPETTYYFGLDGAAGSINRDYGAMLGTMVLYGLSGDDGVIGALLSVSGSQSRE